MAVSRTSGSCGSARPARGASLTSRRPPPSRSVKLNRPRVMALIDLLAGRQPDAGDQRFARQNLALRRRQRLRRVAALVLEQMPQILVGRDAEQPAAALEAGRELEIGEIGAAVACRAASSAPWRDRCGRCRRDAACAAPAWRSGNRRASPCGFARCSATPSMKPRTSAAGRPTAVPGRHRGRAPAPARGARGRTDGAPSR